MITTSSNTSHFALIETPHRFEVVHHYDDKGRHCCPTGFLLCSEVHDGVLCDEYRFGNHCWRHDGCDT